MASDRRLLHRASVSSCVGLSIALATLASGCNQQQPAGTNRSPSAADHPEKLERALAEQERIRQVNMEAERKALRGKELD